MHLLKSALLLVSLIFIATIVESSHLMQQQQHRRQMGVTVTQVDNMSDFNHYNQPKNPIFVHDTLIVAQCYGAASDPAWYMAAFNTSGALLWRTLLPSFTQTSIFVTLGDNIYVNDPLCRISVVNGSVFNSTTSLPWPAFQLHAWPDCNCLVALCRERSFNEIPATVLMLDPWTLQPVNQLYFAGWGSAGMEISGVVLRGGFYLYIFGDINHPKQTPAYNLTKYSDDAFAVSWSKSGPHYSVLTRPIITPHLDVMTYLVSYDEDKMCSQYAVNTATGDVEWSNSSRSCRSIAGGSDAFFFCVLSVPCGESNSESCMHVDAINVLTGITTWSKSLNSTVVQTFERSSETLFVAQSRGVVYAVVTTQEGAALKKSVRRLAVLALDMNSGNVLFNCTLLSNFSTTSSSVVVSDEFASTATRDVVAFLVAHAAYGIIPQLFIISPCWNFSASECPKACIHSFGGCGCHVAADSETCSQPLAKMRGCRWCDLVGVCVNSSTTPACECAAFDKTTCDYAPRRSCGDWCPAGEFCPTANNTNCSCQVVQQETQCHMIQAVGGHCQWCSSLGGVCVNSTASASCECSTLDRATCAIVPDKHCGAWCENLNYCPNINNSKCVCEEIGRGSTCELTVTKNQCKWCSSLGGVCVNSTTSASCECAALDEKTCAVTPRSHCGSWCRRLALCPETNNSNCECDYLRHSWCDKRPDRCQFCHNRGLCSSSGTAKMCDCFNFDKEVICDRGAGCHWHKNVGQLQHYCSSQQCTPVTCEGITDLASCEPAGCRLQGSTACLSGPCFSFFLPSFVAQPLALFLAGLAKDVLVLFLIGAAGDFFARPIQRRAAPCLHWFYGIDNKVKQDFDHTIYIADPSCHDDDDDGDEKSTTRHSDGGEIPQDGEVISTRLQGGNIYSFEEHCLQVADELFDVDDDVQRNPNERCRLLDEIAFSLYDESLWIDFEKGGTPNQDEDERSALLQRGKEGETTKIESEDFATSVALHEKVVGAIRARATRAVFYTSSRDVWKRVANAINSFPSTLQLVYYVLALSLLYVATFYFTFLDAANKQTIQQIATSCGQNSTSVAAAADTATFFLIGFRLLNASSFATAMLVFVKSVRGWWHGRSLSEVTLVQKIPVMTVTSSRAIQIILVVYFLLIAPFALTGPTFGWSLKHSIGAIPVLVGLAALLVDALLLKLIRRYCGGGDTPDFQIGGQHQSNRSELDTVASQQADEEQEQEQQQQQQPNVQSYRTFVSEAHSLTGVPQLFEEGNAPKPPPPTTSVASAAPTSLGKALFVFLFTEELPVIILTLSFQLAFNYTALTFYANDFGLASSTSPSVVQKDFDARKFSCVIDAIKQDVKELSNLVSVFSSVVPFF